MPAHQQCHTCTWYVARSVSQGHCHRHAPSGGGFAPMRWDDFCGDHAPQETSLPEAAPSPVWDDLEGTALPLHDPTDCRFCQEQTTAVPFDPED